MFNYACHKTVRKKVSVPISIPCFISVFFVKNEEGTLNQACHKTVLCIIVNRKLEQGANTTKMFVSQFFNANVMSIYAEKVGV